MNFSSRVRWVPVLLGCTAVSLFCVIYPIYVIRPFRAQGARELAVALIVSRFRPALTVLSALVAAWAVIAYRGRWWRRTLAAIGAVFVFGLAALARVNVYELMFHPDDHPAFAAASGVKIDKDDKLIVVKVNGSARAYPIRTMGYHHIVNDVVGGTALAATY